MHKIHLSRGYLVQFLLLTYVAHIDSTSSAICDKFECDSDKCLTFSSVCNGIHDCLDGTDEGLHCLSATVECVGEYEYLCDDGQCILNTLRCDGSSDCMDGSDEIHCDVDYVQPFCKEFTCDDDQRCLSLMFLCDGIQQCSDGTDERGLHCSSLSADCSGAGEFMCRNGHCLPAMFRCDGSADCVDNSDEKGCVAEKPFRPNGLGTTEKPQTNLEPQDKVSPTTDMVLSTATTKETTTYKLIRTIDKTRKSTTTGHMTLKPTFSQTSSVKKSSMTQTKTNKPTRATYKLFTRMTSSRAPVTKFNVISNQNPSNERANDGNEVETFHSKRASHHMRRIYGGTAVALIVATVAIIVLVAIRRRKQSKPVFKCSIHFINPSYGSA